MALQQSLKRDTVRDLELNPPLVVDSKDSIEKVVQLMRGRSTGCAVVCDRAGKLLGIWTERDLVTRVLAPGLSLSTTIEKVMTANPATLRSDDQVCEVVRRMNAGGFRHLPVIDEGGKVVGIASVRRLIEYLADHFPNSIYTLPPSTQVAAAAREGA